MGIRRGHRLLGRDRPLRPLVGRLPARQPPHRRRRPLGGPPRPARRRETLGRRPARLLHDSTLTTSDRVAGLLLLLYAQRITSIARLTTGHIEVFTFHQGPCSHLALTFWAALGAAAAGLEMILRVTRRGPCGAWLAWGGGA